MPRWRQIVNPETGKSEFVPLDEAARRENGHFVQGDIESFVSPIDGTVISDRKQYSEHCKRHGVVPAAEFDTEFYAKKAEERRRHYEADATRQQRLEIRRELYENMIRAERDAGWH